jgi:hypothetical protein
MNDEEAQNELFESESIQFEKKEEVVALVLEEEEEKKVEFVISEIILNKYKKEDEEEPVEMIKIEDSKEKLSNGTHNNEDELKEETSIEIKKPIQKQSMHL